jgi:hypothetical protein
MSSDLIDHVIKESDPRVDATLILTIEINAEADRCFTRAAYNLRATGWCRNALGEVLPGFLGAPVNADPMSGDSQSPSQFKVRIPIADDGAAFTIQRKRNQVLIDEASVRLAAITGVVRQVGTDQHRIELDALRAEQVQYEFVGGVKIFRGKAVRPETIRASRWSPAITPGISRTLSSRSTWWSVGSSISVPSRSMNSIAVMVC